MRANYCNLYNLHNVRQNTLSPDKREITAFSGIAVFVNNSVIYFCRPVPTF